MTTLDLGQVATFLALTRTGSFRAAARSRALSQGAVSQQLRKLEEALGVCLIARAPRGCTLTPEGMEFLDYAEKLMRLNERAIEALRGRRIALGASSNIGIYLLQPYVTSYLKAIGGRYSVDLQIHQNPVVLEKLETGEIDVAAMEWWDGHAGYVARLWRSEELVVIVAPDHPWADLPRIPHALLKGAPILGGEPGTGIGRLLARYFGEELRELKVTMQLGSTEAVKRWVKSGLGVSLVLAGTVVTERHEGTLAVIPLEGEPLRKDLYVIWRDSLTIDSAPRRFAQWLTEQSASSSA